MNRWHDVARASRTCSPIQANEPYTEDTETWRHRDGAAMLAGREDERSDAQTSLCELGASVSSVILPGAHVPLSEVRVKAVQRLGRRVERPDHRVAKLR